MQLTEKADDFFRKCFPGALIQRCHDGKIGMIVAAERPYWNNLYMSNTNWRFEILIDNVLVDTDQFISNFKPVQV